jgi:hypothetical protein
MNLQVLGPFRIYSNDSENIFHNPIAKESGIYIYAVPYEEKRFLASYVGETGASFLKRIKEHTINTLGGYYRIYDPAALKKGKKELLWNGLWKSTRQGYFNEFMERYRELAPLIYDFHTMFSVFLVPLESEPRLRRRIESAIANHLYQQPEPVGTFMDSDIRYIKHLQKGEKIIQIEISGGREILGFPKSVVV